MAALVVMSATLHPHPKIVTQVLPRPLQEEIELEIDVLFNRHHQHLLRCLDKNLPNQTLSQSRLLQDRTAKLEHPPMPMHVLQQEKDMLGIKS